ncbi:hypothetical protein [Deinococcus cellulosilyticus]|uniref:Uncharacterized protein n=1 Tax=Deinococcus cellulosilyticus (strain DSM 18568 / NBRC 106333 / KACC 11606 / 5516J-15) TaxID=1223518 RepID=A0A511MWF3_DEIC1|nr:hypothetical protein [Deinococcus cellulosilyticus]GEM44456.1 hypothetical protein DC3_00910 [Deinococcus cellulosilyticus NBRC 106333 = KACC 11606]
MLFTLSLGIGLLIGLVFLAVLLLVDRLSRPSHASGLEHASLQWNTEEARPLRAQRS